MDRWKGGTGNTGLQVPTSSIDSLDPVALRWVSDNAAVDSHLWAHGDPDFNEAAPEAGCVALWTQRDDGYIDLPCSALEAPFCYRERTHCTA